MKKPAHLQPIKKYRLYQGAVDQIRALILAKRYKPGNRLPSERELAEKLSIGRPTVREALRILDLMGLIEIRMGDGTYVKEVSFHPYVESIVTSISSRLKIEGDSFVKLWQVRKILEVESAGIACGRMNPQRLESLRNFVREMEKNIENREAFTSAGIQFHQEILEATGNEILILIWNSLWDLIRRSHYRIFKVVQSPQRSLQGHKKIYQALSDGDTIKARRAMDKHLTQEEQVHLAFLKDKKKFKEMQKGGAYGSFIHRQAT